MEPEMVGLSPKSRFWGKNHSVRVRDAFWFGCSQVFGAADGSEVRRAIRLGQKLSPLDRA